MQQNKFNIPINNVPINNYDNTLYTHLTDN